MFTNHRLGEVVHFEYGRNLPDRDRRPGSVPVYGSNGVVGFHDHALVEGPAIVIGRKGSIGEVHYCAGPLWPIDTTYFVDSSRTRCDLVWLALLLKHLQLSELNKATGVPGLSREDVYNLQIRIPPNSVQTDLSRAVMLQLSSADSARAACALQIEIGEMLARAILASAFHGTHPISAGQISEKAPRDWSNALLIGSARLESGHTPSRRHPEWWGGDVPWLALPDIRKLHGKHAYETIENINVAGLANSSARLLPPGTVCLCRDASIGFVTILGRPMATTQHFANWICEPQKLDPEFLMYAFMASFDYLRDLGSGSVLKTIYMHTIESFHVCAPEIGEQRRIARTLRERLAAAEALTEGVKARLVELEELPQWLVAAAFDQPG